MIKRIAAFIAAHLIFFVLALLLVVAATLVFLFVTQPASNTGVTFKSDNAFYKRHEGKLEHMGRNFMADGEDGSVPVKREPGAATDITNIQNGTIVYILNSCLYDGVYWGYTFEYTGAWINLDQLLVLYDYAAFEREHSDDLYNYSGDYAGLVESGRVYAWQWPGTDWPPIVIDGFETGDFNASYAYIDSEGREWGFWPNLRNSINVWICLSDPLNRNMPSFMPAPYPGDWEPYTTYNEIGVSEAMWARAMPIIVVIFVAGLAVITIILAKKYRKPKAKNPNVRGSKSRG